MKYHNESYLRNIAKQIKNNSESDIKNIIKDLKKLLKEAQYEYNMINNYTAPEEIENRKQAVYYYEDLLSLLKEE